MQFTVTKTRFERVANPPHEHIEGVCTVDGSHYTRRQVVDSMAAGNQWATWDGRSTAHIKPLTYCPHSSCAATPYITTAPDHSVTNNLDNLPRC